MDRMRLHASLETLASALPGPPTQRWPQGAPFVQALRHGTMSVELYAPSGADLQQSHQQDELYIVERGTGTLRIGTEVFPFGPGAVFFVAAGVDHRFEGFSDDFRTWVVFWGPEGGEPS